MNFRMLWYGALVESRVDEGAREGARDAGEAVLHAAQERVPLLTGMLRDTGRVDTEGPDATVSYDTTYAAILHEHPEWAFHNGREAHWLEHALEAAHGEVVDAYGHGIRGKL